MISLIRNGCKVADNTLVWLVENLWSDPSHLKETAEVYLTQKSKPVIWVYEDRLYANCEASADAMLELIESFRKDGVALKKMSNFALACGNQLPRVKLLAIYEGLKSVGAKSSATLLENAVQSESSLSMEGATGHPIEAICLERFREANFDRDLKDYGISPKLFTRVHYRGTKTNATEFVVKCAIYPYMFSLQELPRRIGNYQSDFIRFKPDPKIDEIADTLEQQDLQDLLENLIHRFDPFKWRLLIPYCRYGSGKQMNAIAALIKKWQVWHDYNADGRKFIIVLHGAMMLNDTREAMLLMEKWRLLDEYARCRNTTADVLRDTVLTEFDLDATGSKRYDLGNATMIASLGEDLSIHLFNETTGKDAKSLPKRGSDPEKYAAANSDFSDLKKNLKKAVKNRREHLKVDFVSGKEVKTTDWKASYSNNYVLKRIASLVVWQWEHEEVCQQFMMTMDGNLVNCNEQPIALPDEGIIRLAHPVELSVTELECWQRLLTEKKIAQPFVQMFEPVYNEDPAETARRYAGVKLPYFLLTDMAKEGIIRIDYNNEVTRFVLFQGQATSIEGNVEVNSYFSLITNAHNNTVKIENVKINGTPRAMNHEIYILDKAMIENSVHNGDIQALQTYSNAITAKTIQHLIDVSIQMEQMECTAWLMNYKNEHFPFVWEDLQL